MLVWGKLFLIFFFCIFFSFSLIRASVVYLVIHSELLLVILFFLFLWVSVVYSLDYLIGLAFCYLILGGMELALSLLLFNL